MKLLVISTWDPTQPNNGARIRAHYLTRALAARHDVTLVTFGEEGAPDGEALGITELLRVTADPFRFVKLPQVVKFASPRQWRSGRLQR